MLKTETGDLSLKVTLIYDEVKQSKAIQISLIRVENWTNLWI